MFRPTRAHRSACRHAPPTLLALAFAFALAAVPGYAASPPAAPARASAAAPLGPATYKIERFTLDNGLVVLTHEDHSVPAVCFWQWYRVGSRNERPGITGISHFFEHMMFNGSKNVPPKEYDQRLESAGGYSNAFTSLDMTAYYEEAGSSALDLMLALDSDRMASLSLLPEQLKSEIGVVKEERRLRTDNDISGLLDEQLYAAAFMASPYGWPTIGWMGDLNRIQRDEMVDYFRTYYAPNNCNLILIGDFDTKTALQKIKDTFGRIPKQTPPAAPINSEPEQKGERRVDVHYPAETVSFDIGYKAPNARSDDYYALELLAAILSGGESSRLHQALVYEQQIALDASTSFRAHLEPCLFEVYVEMKPGKSAAAGEAAVDSVLAKLAREGPSARELQKAKNQMEANFVKRLKTNNGAGEIIGYYEHVFGDYRKMFDAIGRYRAVTIADCKRVARDVFNDQRRTIAVLIPEPNEEAAR